MGTFPVDAVRQQFPALAGRAVYRLDNPAGTQVPHLVIDVITAALSGAASNLGGYFDASREADAIYARARRNGGVLGRVVG